MIEGTDLVYRNYVDISVAVSAPKGLVVPVIRNAETLNFADIEKTIADFGKRAKNGTLTIEEVVFLSFRLCVNPVKTLSSLQRKPC